MVDFGLVKLTEDGVGTGIVGMFGYMSPEYDLRTILVNYCWMINDVIALFLNCFCRRRSYSQK